MLMFLVLYNGHLVVGAWSILLTWSILSSCRLVDLLILVDTGVLIEAEADLVRLGKHACTSVGWAGSRDIMQDWLFCLTVESGKNSF